MPWVSLARVWQSLIRLPFVLGRLLLELLPVLVFVGVAASTVAIPTLAYAGAGHRLDEPMARLKDWMERNNAALLAAILVLIGLMVLYNGVHPLLNHA